MMVMRLINSHIPILHGIYLSIPILIDTCSLDPFVLVRNTSVSAKSQAITKSYEGQKCVVPRG